VVSAVSGADVTHVAGDSLLGWAANGEIVTVDEADVVFSSASGKEVFRLSFEAGANGMALSPDGRFIAASDGQLAFVRTSDHHVLRVSITEEKGVTKTVPPATEIAAFMQ